METKMNRRSLVLSEQREAVYERQDGRCAYCGMPMLFDDFELAHVLAESRDNIRKFGRAVVDDVDNKRGTHRGECNSGVLMNPDSIQAKEHAVRIMAKQEALR
jgi:hypothetical protein